MASRRYKRYLTITKGGKIRIDRSKIRKAAKYDGKWVLETNDDTISLEDAACGYKSLMLIERCFRSLKRTQIKLMPLYHWLPKRIEVHVKICVLALLIERVAEVDCEMSWPRIRRVLSKLQATKFLTKDYRFAQRNEIASEVRNVLNKLNIAPPKRVLYLEKEVEKV